MYDKNKHYHKNQYFMTKNTIKFLYVLGQQQFKKLEYCFNSVCTVTDDISRLLFWS